ncbi:response regulator [Shimia sp. MMG029]|uniref:response regulator n=1 Tax=Shimia sp. MMG029 TaxID=3021978 RepID=UPI0022FEA512|nr:response regulator [Shimia sp. MMG029]MDA5556377.1 response regulator [Shimia sp. MMG029]
MAEFHRILHVEDDPDIREITLLALKELGGFDVLQCDNGEDALLRAAAFEPDLLLLDVMLPGLSGIETLIAMRKIPDLAEVPAVFLTSRDVSAQDECDIRDRAIGAIQKPFDPVTLPDQLRRMVAAREPARA